MPYLGNPVVDRFTSTKAASVYSGDGSTVAFTLEHSVGSDEDILVSVDGVIQEPSVAYAVSSGTTLTFTAAPSTNAGNNIFVYYLFRTIGTVTHPPTSALSATSGTFTGNVTVGDGSAADKKILFDGNAQDYHIGLDDSTDSLTIGKGSALGTTTSMAIDADGIIGVNYIDLLVKRVAELEKELEDISLTQGPKGDTGLTGATGATGATGSAGLNGLDGNSHLENVTSITYNSKTKKLEILIDGHKSPFSFTPALTEFEPGDGLLPGLGK